MYRRSRNTRQLIRRSKRKHTYKKADAKAEALFELEQTQFPKCTSRKNISNKEILAFVLGDVNYRGQESVNYRTRGPSRFNKKYKQLYKVLRDLIKHHDPEFKYTTIQVNKNVFCAPHVDKNNVGPSYVIALGDFTGGHIVVEGREKDIRNTFLKFDGTKGHWITPFKGTRYSIVYFQHTFKPPHPSLRNIQVKHDGLYKDSVRIKSYAL